MDDDVKARLFIIKDNIQDIRLPCLMLFDAVNFIQDSPYPFTGAS
jgi:hypothetical protein